jgi:hypothetical protein
MEWVIGIFFGWMRVCLPAIIFTAVANGRRRETAELNGTWLAVKAGYSPQERSTSSKPLGGCIENMC